MSGLMGTCGTSLPTLFIGSACCGPAALPSFSGLKFTDADVGGEGVRCLTAAQDGRRLAVFNGFDAVRGQRGVRE